MISTQSAIPYALRIQLEDWNGRTRYCLEKTPVFFVVDTVWNVNFPIIDRPIAKTA